MNLEGKKVLVVGLGRTGEAVCEFLLQEKAKVKISEKRRENQISEKIKRWTERGVSIESGGHRRSSFLEADLIVPSPGVPPIAEVKEALHQGVEVISEIELAFRYLKGKIIGITGTNGKSTTATLAHQILTKGGIKSFLAGNIGTPLIGFAAASQDDHVYVTELSSFQLEYINTFRAAISVILNVTPDHLDWHQSFEDYFAAKKRLVKLQTDQEKAVLNRDDPLVWALNNGLEPSVIGFSRKVSISPGCFIDNDWIVCAIDKPKKVMSVEGIPLFGVHNLENVMAAACIGRLWNVPTAIIKNCVAHFKGLEHRLEKVTVLRGVAFYNDSKATNVGATLKSIQSFDQKVVLILGGRDKGGDFEMLREPASRGVKEIILLGEASAKIAKALRNGVPMKAASSVKEAVELGFAAASPGEIVLLAPACTSFDMFADFEERGRVFKREVLAMKERIATGDKS
jgi:UDP-N-acetylmuramoylalanine--D-glutamate ligase